VRSSRHTRCLATTPGHARQAGYRRCASGLLAWIAMIALFVVMLSDVIVLTTELSVWVFGGQDRVTTAPAAGTDRKCTPG
jgi:hypothetical protein